MKKLIFLFFLLLMTFSGFVYAEGEITNFTVTERNNVSVSNHLVQRGIPIPEGMVKDTDLLVVKDSSGREITTQCKVLTKHKDTSVKWMSVAFLCDLNPAETKSYSVYKHTGNAADNMNVVQPESKQTVTVNNGKMTVVFDKKGIRSIAKDGNNILGSDGISSVCKEDNIEYGLIGGSVEITELGPVYTKIKVKSDFSGGSMREEHYYTIAMGDEKIGCDYKIISSNGVRAGKATINSWYESYDLSEHFTHFEYQSEDILTTDKSSAMYSCGWLKASDNNGMNFIVVSKDVEKFRNYKRVICNGFKWENGKIIFAPMLYDTTETLRDGTSKTIKADIIISASDTSLSQLKTQTDTPQVAINPQAYVNAGITKSAQITDVAKTQINGVLWTKQKNYGRYRAGSIPYQAEPETNTISQEEVPQGGIPFNLWYAQMLSGNGELYDVMLEHERCTIDDTVYEGASIPARGLGRYRVNDTYNGVSSHPFYSEFSHLYMTYCITGDEYYKDIMKEMADAIYKTSMMRKFSGYNVPSIALWYSTDSQFTTTMTVEIRYMFMIRAMQYAYELFGDENYKYITEQIKGWLEETQTDDGSWAQLYYVDGSPQVYEQIGQVAYKNYIMLFGLRGAVCYWRETGDIQIEPTLIKFADYLISERQNGQWMWDPVADTDKSKYNEDGQRGNAPQQEIMSVEILLAAYDMTATKNILKHYAAISVTV